VAGDGRFLPYRTFDVPAGESVGHDFPEWLNAYWIRAVSDRAGILSAQLAYE
jgi:hypothetical protein